MESGLKEDAKQAMMMVSTGKVVVKIENWSSSDFVKARSAEGLDEGLIKKRRKCE